MRVGRCKNLHLKKAEDPTSSPSPPKFSTPPRPSTPPHRKLCSPGDIPIEANFLTPKESYEMGMQQAKNYHGEH